MLKLDTHAHWFPPEWVELLEHEGAKNGAEISRNAQGKLVMVTTSQRLRPNLTPPYIELAIRLKLMDDARVDMHALSLTSPMVYWAPPEFGLKLSQVFNDGCAAAHLKYPNRIIGMA